VATLAAVANGNLTSASTWGLISSLLNSESSADTLTTAYAGTRSSAFTPGAIVIDGIGVKLRDRLGTTGTISVELAQAGTPVAGTEVTINVSDLPAATSAQVDGGWIFFKFGTPVTLAGATAYTVEAKTSTATMVNLYTNGTTDNISHYLRTTTTQAPVAGDDLIVAGEWTAAGAQTARTVTVDQTAATDYGTNTTTAVTPAVAVCQGGTFAFGTTGGIAYLLRLSGHLVVYNGGTFTMGTTGTKMPSNSSAALEFDGTADGDFGIYVRNGTLTLQGNPLTCVSAKLAADAAASATSLTTDVSTGWLSGDQVVIATTTRTASQSEVKTMSGNATGTSVPIAALTNAHSGTSPTQAEVVNITRNVKIRAVTSTLMTFVCISGTTPAVDVDYAELYYVGTNAGQKRGLEVDATGGSVNIAYSSVHDVETGGIWLSTASGLGVVLSNNVLWLTDTVVGFGAITTVVTTASHTIDGNIAISTGNGVGFTLGDLGSTVTNNVVAGQATGFNVTDNSVLQLGTFSGNVAHGCAGAGFLFSPGAAEVGFTVSSCTAWRNSTNGFSVAAGAILNTVTFASCTAFGNGTNTNQAGFIFTGSGGILVLRSCVSYGGSTLTQLIGLRVTCAAVVYAFDCTFGSPSANSSYDLDTGFAQATLINCLLASTTEINTLQTPGFVHSHKHDQGTGHRNAYPLGVVTSETTTRHTASGFAWKLAPSSATRKLIFPGPSQWDTFKCPVNASALVTVTVWVYKDASYNGAQPRLVLVGGLLAGVGSAGSDVTATMTGGTLAWEQLTATATPSEAGQIEATIQVDGTAGAVFVDDMAVSQA
jgi:hypothetical protein